MNSIHEAIRKFRPDLKLDGWNNSARLVPAAAVYPETIRPEMIMRGLANPEAAESGPPQAPPLKFSFSMRQIGTLALLFALALVAGAGLALRPARVGDVKANVPDTARPVYQIAMIKSALPPVAPVAAPRPVAKAEPPARKLAPLKLAAQTVSLQPVKQAKVATAAPTYKEVAAVSGVPVGATTNFTPDSAPLEVAAAAPVQGDVPEILYESDSPESLPEMSAPPAAAAQAPAPPKRSAAASSSNASGSALRVQGIFWEKERPMALLGDDIVEIGSETPLGKIVEITQKNVVFEQGGKRVTLAP